MKMRSFKTILILLFGLGIFWLTIFIGKQWHLWGKTTYTALTQPESVLFSQDGRTNIALLGAGGTGHDGGDLIDTIIIASIDVKNESNVALISIPRDLWIPDIEAKINHAFRIGAESIPQNPEILVKKTLTQVTGLPIHYYVLVDFTGFTALIDHISGIDITVEKGFVDEKYPIPGRENAMPESSRYETITFSAGRQHMDGATALKFVRSRNAKGEEGNDTARSRRQQLVLAAIREKIAANSISNPRSIAEYQTLFTTYVKSDIMKRDYPAFVALANRYWNTQTQKIQIPSALSQNNYQATDLLVHPGISKIYGNQWVLIAKNGNFEKIHQYIQSQIQNQISQSSSTQRE